MAVLETRGVERHYGAVKAVNGIDLRTAEGEFLAILGPSGSGKTTLMRLIAGLEQPTAGDILMSGHSVVGVPPRKRNVAMVFQSYAIYPHMTVRENITFPLESRKVPKALWNERVERTAELLGIRHLLNRRPARLSGGEKQRVALARALVRDPELFVFDEPLSALDAQVRSVARAELRDLHKRTRITTLYVTHDQLEALGLGDRVAVMHEGRLHQIGTPEELYFDPADVFVASFVGNPPMNLIERNGTMLGIRCEHFSLRPSRKRADSEMRFRIKVDQVQFLGAQWLAYGTEADDRGAGRIVIQLAQEQGAKIHPGEAYDFVVARRRIRIFDKASGARISGSLA
jgi:multiple sugar transport system ATP-binding protein